MRSGWDHLLRRPAAGAAAIVAIVGLGVVVPVTLAGGASPRGAAVQPPAAEALTSSGTGHCYGKYPGTGAWGSTFYYAPGCYGHDEPEVDPISSAAGSAQNITWTIKLAKDSATAGGVQQVDLGPTFWFGAMVNDPKSLSSEAYLELQFYPDTTLTSPYCGSDGSFYTTHTPNKFTVCSPVWALDPTTYNEYAAFNKMLTPSGSSTPMVMNAGDMVTVHIFKGTQAGTPLNIVVKDVTLNKTSSAIAVVSSADGPLAPAASQNTPANYLKWGSAEGTPLSFSWEIGHPNFYNFPNAPQCDPGQFNCLSYNINSGWLKAPPVQITSAIFGTSTKPSSWGVTDSQGGSGEVAAYCGSYGASAYQGVSAGGSCTFPWYTYNGTDKAIVYGGNFAGTTNSYGTYTQFPSTASCLDTTFSYDIFCNTTLSPTPPIP